MLTSTEFFTNTPLLQNVLWIEAAIYLAIGLYEMFDDFVAKPEPWMRVKGRDNAWIQMQHKIGHKMHSGICILLGFVALNGALEGKVTRFELELIFLSFAILMPAIWMLLMPGVLGIVVTITKPEFWLQIVMFVYFSHLIRPEILVLCILLNFWGIFVNFFHTRKKMLNPFTYETLRRDYIDAMGEDTVRRLDTLAFKFRRRQE